VPSFTIHLLIPALLLLAARRFPDKMVFALLPLTLVPDLDFFIPPHRALLHSIFLPLAVGALAWHWRRRGDARWEWAMVATFYIASHPFMDLFAGGVVPLWPLSDQTFFIDLEVLIDTRTLQPTPIFEPGTVSGVPEVSPVYEFFSPLEAAMAALTLPVAAFFAWRRARRVKREIVIVAE